MQLREFLMKDHKYQPGINVAGWYMSEKLDGMRAFWDGGISRGVSTLEVPWAGITDPKTHQPKNRIKPLATGLWSQIGEVVDASEAFLNQLPPIMLDGFLLNKQKTLQYAVFSSPHPANFAFEGLIRNSQMYCLMNADKIMEFIEKRNKILGGGFLRVQDGATFDEELICLRTTFEDSSPVFLHYQRKLPEENYEQILEKVLTKSNKGIILRDPTSQWEPRRVKTMLEYIK